MRVSIASGKTSAPASANPRQAIPDDQADATQAPVLQVLQECEPARFVLLRPFDDAEDFAIPLRVNAGSDQERHVPHLPRPRPLQDDS
jgi:hypothetical protein